MTRKLLIMAVALALVGCAGRTNDKKSENEENVKLVPFTAEELAKGITEEYGIVKATPELLDRLNVARFQQYGLTGINSLDPFEVGSNEVIPLKDPETANGGLNNLRFEG